MHTLHARGLRPLADLAAVRPHGDRLRYLAGCRCLPCRAANAQYERQRQQARREGEWNGIVPARAARRHILFLSRRGVGRRAIHDATDIAQSTLSAIRTGKKTHIRARTARKILDVSTAERADHAHIPATRLWRLIQRLLDEGYTKRDLARRLGYRSPALQFRKQVVTVRNAFRIQRLYDQLTT